MSDAINEAVEQPVDPVWVEDQCGRFDQVLALFTSEMRAEFRRRALKGRAHWEQAEQVHGMWLRGVELMAKTPRAAGNEAAVANYMAFLFMHRTQQIGTVTHGARTAVLPTPNAALRKEEG